MNAVFIGFDEFAAALGIAADTAQEIFDKAAYTTALAIRRDAQALVPKRTYSLMSSIIAEPLPEGAMVTVQQPYGMYVEYGTGLFGPKRQRITPKRAKVLAWKGNGGMVFARSTAGMPAKPYFNPAVDAGAVTLAETFGLGLTEIVEELAHE